MNKVKVLVEGYNYNRLIQKCVDYNVELFNINYIDNEKITIVISYDDYIKISNNLRYYKFSILEYYGAKKYINYFKKNIIIILSFLLSIILLFLLSNIIVSVEVIHSNKKIKDIIYTELEKDNIKKYSFKKSYKELEKIKQKILAKYKSKIEWIEIKNIGMTYKVYIEERIINDIKDEKEYCNVIALKDGIITKIIASKGEVLVEKNKTVQKSDILISGNINEIKTCASGLIYAEVWYTVNIKLPLNYEEKIITNNKRKNISYKYGNIINKIFKSKYKYYEVKRKELLDLFNIKLFVDTEYEVNIKKKKYNEEQALNKAIELADSKFKTNFVEKEKIMYKKVLKNEVNNSTMELEIFYATEEIISVVE